MSLVCVIVLVIILPFLLVISDVNLGELAVLSLHGGWKGHRHAIRTCACVPWAGYDPGEKKQLFRCSVLILINNVFDLNFSTKIDENGLIMIMIIITILIIIIIIIITTTSIIIIIIIIIIISIITTTNIILTSMQLSPLPSQPLTPSSSTSAVHISISHIAFIIL